MSRLSGLVATALLLPVLSIGLGADPWTLHPDAAGAPISWAHPLGRDELGRDVLARLVFGFGVSVGLAAASAVLSTALGSGLGAWAGTRGGRLDVWLSRTMELTQSIPKLPLLLLVGSLDLRRLGVPIGIEAVLLRLLLLFTLLGWLTAFRVTRQASLELTRRPFVEAARALGLGEARVMLRHVLPHLSAPIRVVGAIAFGEFLLLESGLSFLGLGVPPPWPSLGNLLAHGASSGLAPLLWAPGLATTAVLVFVSQEVDPRPAAFSPSPEPTPRPGPG